MNRRTERIVKRITGIVLAAVLLSTTLIQHASAAEVVKISYISEISVGSKADLEANGFTVCSAASGTITLSTGQEITTSGISSSFTENDCIGYKTTLDRSKAITDVKIMHMNGGFEKIDMDSFVNENADGVSETIDIVFAALTEFRENYENGSRPAKIAYQTLNYMDVPQLDGSEDIPLGDYLLDVARTRNDIRDIVLLADTAVVNYIKNQLILGVADDMSANTEGLELTDEEKQAPPDLAAIEAYTWLDRLVNNGTFEENITDREELESTYIEYDKSYYQQTFSVINSVRNFAADYKAALERQGSLQEAAEKVAEEQEAAEKSGEETSATDVIEGRSEGNQAADDLNILVLYDYLDQRLEDGSPVYFYGKKADGSVRSFAEFLIEVGEMDPETEDQEARHLLYPLFIKQAGETPMTAGQWSILRISDLNTFLMSTVYEKVDYETIIKNVNEQGNELLAANGTERLSIWYSVDYEFYKNGGEVYATSDTIRMQAANDKFDLLTKKSYKDNSLTDSQKAKNVIIGLGIAAASAFTVTQILFMFQSKIVATAIAEGATAAASVSSVVAGSCATLATVASVCMVITAILIVCVLIAFLVFLFLRKEEKEEEEEAKRITMLPIPEFLLDTRQTDEDTLVKLQYRAVCAPGTDTPQNLNRMLDNTPWCVLYTTVDPDAGEPLSVTNQDGTERTPFVFTTNATQEVEKYCPMTMFEESAPGNLRGEASGKSVFAWFHRVDDVESPKGFYAGKYVLKVELYSATNETVARDQIRKKAGFTLIDYDLTPDLDGTYTYLGYSTTDNPEFALKDLRFAYNPGIDKNAGQLSYGDCVYSVFGSVGNLLLMGSKSDMAGSPILADGFQITDKLGVADPGYEPVNLFSGGPALDISSCGNWVAGTGMGEGNETQLLKNENEHVYLYFLPEVTYTGGTEYLGGLCFFGAMSGSGEKKKPGDGFVPEGWKRLSDTDVSGNQRGSMYLYYYPTYNPKRAITDVKYYQAEPNATQVAYNISYGSEGSYVAADVWQQGTRLVFDTGLDYASYTWLLRASHSYRSNQFYEGGGFYESITADTMRKVDDGSNATMEYYRVTYTDGSSKIIGTNIRNTALYLGGPCKAKEPLKASDISARGSSEFDATSETPVRNFTDAYSATGANLGYQGAAGNIEWTVSWSDSIERSESVTHTYYTETMKLEKTSNYSSLYLFIERKDPYSERGRFVKSVTVSYAGNDRNASGSRSGYGAKYTEDGQTGYDIPYDTICYDLFRNGPGQLIRKNMASGSSGGSTLTSEWDDWAIGSHTTGVTADQITKRDALSEIEDIKESQRKPCIESDYSTEVAYLWVTYTNITKDGISDLLIYETNMPDTAKTTMNFYVTSDAEVKQSATLCGEGWKPDPSGYTWCYLYAVKNLGHQVKELLVDEEPLTYQYKTVLTTDFKCSVSRRVFLKTKNRKTSYLQSYIYNIAFGEGATRRDALIGLLDSGCPEFIPFNTTTTEGRYGYLGYGTTTSKNLAYSGFLLYNTEYNKTAKTLDFGYINFHVLSDNLNPTVEGYAVYLFGTRDILFNELYQTLGEKQRYATKICAYPGKDLNDYALGNKELESIEDSTLREYTAFLISEDDGDPVYWAAIGGVEQQVMSLNLGGEYLSKGADKRMDLYMYVQYSDDYYGPTIIKDNDTASIFIGRSLPALVGGGAAVLLAALAAILYKKRREQATGKEKV